MTLEAEFADAQDRVNGLSERPDNMTLLNLYALYKQATVGDVSGKRPGALDFKGRAKYDAWAARQGMSADDAMQAYIELVNQLA